MMSTLTSIKLVSIEHFTLLLFNKIRKWGIFLEKHIKTKSVAVAGSCTAGQTLLPIADRIQL